MIEPMYKKGNRLAWIGFVLVIIYAFVAVFGSFLPSLHPFVSVSIVFDVVGIALMFWGSILALRSKNRSLWWLLFFLLALSGAGVIFVAIIFMLKDKSATSPSVPTASSSTPL
jgi:hypothetical protein